MAHRLPRLPATEPRQADWVDHPNRQRTHQPPAQVLDDRPGGLGVGDADDEGPAGFSRLRVDLQSEAGEVAGPLMAGAGDRMLRPSAVAADAPRAAIAPRHDQVVGHQQRRLAVVACVVEVVIALPGSSLGIVPVAPPQVRGVVGEPRIGQFGPKQVGGVAQQPVAVMRAVHRPARHALRRPASPPTGVVRRLCRSADTAHACARGDLNPHVLADTGT